MVEFGQTLSDPTGSRVVVGAQADTSTANLIDSVANIGSKAVDFVSDRVDTSSIAEAGNKLDALEDEVRGANLTDREAKSLRDTGTKLNKLSGGVTQGRISESQFTQRAIALKRELIANRPHLAPEIDELFNSRAGFNLEQKEAEFLFGAEREQSQLEQQINKQTVTTAAQKGLLVFDDSDQFDLVATKIRIQENQQAEEKLKVSKRKRDEDNITREEHNRQVSVETNKIVGNAIDSGLQTFLLPINQKELGKLGDEQQIIETENQFDRAVAGIKLQVTRSWDEANISLETRTKLDADVDRRLEDFRSLVVGTVSGIEAKKRVIQSAALDNQLEFRAVAPVTTRLIDLFGQEAAALNVIQATLSTGQRSAAVKEVTKFLSKEAEIEVIGKNNVGVATGQFGLNKLPDDEASVELGNILTSFNEFGKTANKMTPQQDTIILNQSKAFNDFVTRTTDLEDIETGMANINSPQWQNLFDRVRSRQGGDTGLTQEVGQSIITATSRGLTELLTRDPLDPNKSNIVGLTTISFNPDTLRFDVSTREGAIAKEMKAFEERDRRVAQVDRGRALKRANIVNDSIDTLVKYSEFDTTLKGIPKGDLRSFILANLGLLPVETNEPSREAILLLQNNPALVSEFDAQFGEGEAAKILDGT